MQSSTFSRLLFDMVGDCKIAFGTYLFSRILSHDDSIKANLIFKLFCVFFFNYINKCTTCRSPKVRIRSGSMNYKKCFATHESGWKIMRNHFLMKWHCATFWWQKLWKKKIWHLIQRCVKPLHSMVKLPFFSESAPMLHINQMTKLGRLTQVMKDQNGWDKNRMEISMSIESIAIGANLFCHPMSQVQTEVFSNLVKWNRFPFRKRKIFFAAATHGIAHFYKKKNIYSYVSIYFGRMFILFIIPFLFL